MQKLRVVLMVFIAFSLILTVACSNNSNNTGNNGGNNGANNSGSKVAETPPPAEQKPVEETPPVEEERQIDMNGEELRILHWAAEPDPNTPEGEKILARWKEAEEKYNVKIVYEKTPWGENIKMVTNAALSGESVGDIVALDYYQAIPAVKDGLFMPVDDFFDFSDPKWPTNLTQYGTFNGKMYGFTANNNTASGIYYNKTLFEREGLPDPHDLIAQDKWNWESFLDIMKKATKDTDGDGVVDQYGLTNIAPNLLRILIHSNGASIIEEKDGKHVYASENPKVVEAARFFSDLFNVHKVVAPNKSGDFNDYNDSQTLFAAGKAAMVTGELWEGAMRTTMTDEQGFVYFPKGPGRPDSYQGSVENYIAYYIPANVKRAEEKAYIWDQIQMWDRFEDINRQDAELQLLADEKDIEVMVDIPRYSEPVFLPVGGAVGDVAWSIARNGESPETALERTRQVAQDAIDQVYNAQ